MEKELKNYTLAIVSLIKNELLYLKEWIEYHLKIADEIFLYEDEGSLSHEDICKEYSNVHLDSVANLFKQIHRPSIQTDIANVFVRTHDFTWTAFIDVDEFLDGDFSLLNKYKESLLLYWHNYNANGHLLRPEGNVLSNFTTECGNNRIDKLIWITKPIAYGKDAIWDNVHWTRKYIKVQDLYIRHYITKSFEEFCWKLYERGDIYNRIYRDIYEFFELNPDMNYDECKDYIFNKYGKKIKSIMTTNEALAKYNFISKVIMKSETGELSKELKVKIMSMRIELSKIKKSYEEDTKAFAEQIITDDFRTLAQKQDKTDEEYNEYVTQEAKINEAYNEYLRQLGTKEVVTKASLTETEYEDLMKVNIANDVEINGQKINSGDFLEIIYDLFVE